MTGISFVGPTAADARPAPLGASGYAQAMVDDQDVQRQALAQAIDELRRNPPRSPAALAEDLAAQALLQYGQSQMMRGTSDTGSDAGGWSTGDPPSGYGAILASLLGPSPSSAINR